MGAKQAKSADEAGASPQSARSRRTPTRERSNDVRASLVLRAGERLARAGPPPPYQRRVGMIQDMMLMAKQGKQDEATEMLRTLRQVRESRLLDVTHYKNITNTTAWTAQRNNTFAMKRSG